MIASLRQDHHLQVGLLRDRPPSLQQVGDIMTAMCAQEFIFPGIHAPRFSQPEEDVDLNTQDPGSLPSLANSSAISREEGP